MSPITKTFQISNSETGEYVEVRSTETAVHLFFTHEGGDPTTLRMSPITANEIASALWEVYDKFRDKK